KVVVKVALLHLPLLVEVTRKNIGILVDAPVLNRAIRALSDRLMRAKTMVQEKDLKRERPPRHVSVEVHQVGIVRDRLKMRSPAKAFGEHMSQRRLAGANVAGNGDKNLRTAIASVLDDLRLDGRRTRQAHRPAVDEYARRTHESAIP